MLETKHRTSPAGFTAQRARMLDEQLRERGIRDQAVLRAMARVPREVFVPESERERAYEDCALQLPHDQTISQPYMVARAVELARLAPSDHVLEVGLGSGYQAAVLSRLCERVIGIEIIPELAKLAQRALDVLEYQNVLVQVADGSLGFPSHAPYDAIVVAAGAPRVPPALIDQLRIGGRLVIPVGPKTQTLSVLTRTASGVTTDEYDACIYVPLRGAAGWSN
ncbi:MAG: protein-L-isoaspartate(D-aspartate) O-methyltransferase [Polyangiales bacterium]